MNDFTREKIDKLFGLNSAAVMALVTLCVSVLLGGYYIGKVYGEVQRAIGSVEQDQLCQSIRSCAVCGALQDVAAVAVTSARDAQNDVLSNEKDLQEWKGRVKTLESKVYELVTNPRARRDSFTGTMGAALEARIKQLESK